MSLTPRDIPHRPLPHFLIVGAAYSCAQPTRLVERISADTGTLTRDGPEESINALDLMQGRVNRRRVFSQHSLDCVAK